VISPMLSDLLKIYMLACIGFMHEIGQDRFVGQVLVSLIWNESWLGRQNSKSPSSKQVEKLNTSQLPTISIIRIVSVTPITSGVAQQRLCQVIDQH
jgi:hypothetical protein